MGDELYANGKPDTTEFLAGVPTEHMVSNVANWSDVCLCLSRTETRVVSHVDDPLICAKPPTLEKIWMQITKLVVFKREKLSPPRPCGLPWIRAPKCTRWRPQRIHSETYRQVR